MLSLSYINYYYNLCCQLLYRTVSDEGCYRVKTVLPGLRNTTPSNFFKFFLFLKNILNQQISRKLLTELYFEIHFYSAIIKFSFFVFNKQDTQDISTYQVPKTSPSKFIWTKFGIWHPREEWISWYGDIHGILHCCISCMFDHDY